MELPKQAIASLKLENLVLITLGEANSSGLLPVSVDIATLDYDAITQKSDHYLLRDAPYSVVRGDCKSASLRNKLPDASHYSLGPAQDIEYVAADRNRTATFVRYIPILFWKGKA